MNYPFLILDVDYSFLVLDIVYAIIPSILICLYVYHKDVVEKEPIMMLFRLFFLGVLMTVPTFFIEKTLISFSGIQPDGYINCFIMSFFIISLVEEGYKYLILYLGSWKNKNFDYKFDAIVYAVFVSLGFATLENILYVSNYGANAAFLRAVISVPAHAFYAVASGYFLGLAKKNAILKNRKEETKYKILALAAPVFLHGVFDFLLLTENNVMLGVFYAFVGALYAISFLSIDKVSKNEKTGLKESSKKLKTSNNIQENSVQEGMVNPLDFNMNNKVEKSEVEPKNNIEENNNIIVTNNNATNNINDNNVLEQNVNPVNNFGLTNNEVPNVFNNQTTPENPSDILNPNVNQNINENIQNKFIN